MPTLLNASVRFSNKEEHFYSKESAAKLQLVSVTEPIPPKAVLAKNRYVDDEDLVAELKRKNQHKRPSTSMTSPHSEPALSSPSSEPRFFTDPNSPQPVAPQPRPKAYMHARTHARTHVHMHTCAPQLWDDDARREANNGAVALSSVGAVAFSPKPEPWQQQDDGDAQHEAHQANILVISPVF